MNDRFFKTYTRLILVMGFLVLGVIAVRSLWVDPYWVWQQEPGWLQEHGGHNRVLDIRMRHAKALQVVVRHPEAVILGSSRAYRGFDTTTGLAQGFYNMGISSLRIAEAQKYVEHLVAHTPVKRLILGMEYYMFDADETFVAGFDQDIGSNKYLLTAFPASLLTGQAWGDAGIAQAGLHSGDGIWNHSGFKTTNDRDAADLLRISRKFKKHRTSDRQYEQLAALLKTAVQAGLDIQVYLSPMSGTYLNALHELQEEEEFAAWRQRVAAVTLAQGVDFHDFSMGTDFSSSHVVESSTEFWIDASHFRPIVGEWILQQLVKPAGGLVAEGRQL